MLILSLLKANIFQNLMNYVMQNFKLRKFEIDSIYPELWVLGGSNLVTFTFPLFNCFQYISCFSFFFLLSPEIKYITFPYKPLTFYQESKY